MGSSPRVRGKRRPRPRVPGNHGLIPARAGKTTPSPTSSPPDPAHPRACGENLHGPVVRAGRGGLIPARAGKTRPASRWASPSTAHPRACGENPGGRRGGGAPPGSSPRVRGKRRGHTATHRPLRLIPARAGKTYRLRGTRNRRGAHPRACGENFVPMLRGHFGDGSSPRVRGKRVLGGERYDWGGSSPRVRGKRPSTKGMIRRERLIPARAGKTKRRLSAARMRSAHPRACGENLGIRTAQHTLCGSSPRVRGKRPGIHP